MEGEGVGARSSVRPPVPDRTDQQKGCQQKAALLAQLRDFTPSNDSGKPVNFSQGAEWVESDEDSSWTSLSSQENGQINQNPSNKKEASQSRGVSFMSGIMKFLNERIGNKTQSLKEKQEKAEAKKLAAHPINQKTPQRPPPPSPAEKQRTILKFRPDLEQEIKNSGMDQVLKDNPGLAKKVERSGWSDFFIKEVGKKDPSFANEIREKGWDDEVLKTIENQDSKLADRIRAYWPGDKPLLPDRNY